MRTDRQSKKCKQMAPPIFTRWWLVGKQACALYEDWIKWKMIMEGILKMLVTNRSKITAIREIVSAN